MNEDTIQDSNFNLLDTILRIFGIAGLLCSVFVVHEMAGENPLRLIHQAELALVFSVTFCGFLSTCQATFLAYIPNAALACVVKPKPNPDHCEISECGRRYAAVGGGLTAPPSNPG